MHGKGANEYELGIHGRARDIRPCYNGFKTHSAKITVLRRWRRADTAPGSRRPTSEYITSQFSADGPVLEMVYTSLCFLLSSRFSHENFKSRSLRCSAALREATPEPKLLMQGKPHAEQQSSEERGQGS